MSDNDKDSSPTYECAWETLGRAIARGIIKEGDEPGRPCTRIQFKYGQWTETGELEHNGGGLCEAALANVISRLLRNGDSD